MLQLGVYSETCQTSKLHFANKRKISEMYLKPSQAHLRWNDFGKIVTDLGTYI